MKRSELIAIAKDALRGCGINSELYPSIGLFVSHHLDEIPAEYWREQLGQVNPDPQSVLSILVPILDDDMDEEDETEDLPIDFSLPGGISNYVLSVYIDAGGNIDDGRLGGWIGSRAERQSSSIASLMAATIASRDTAMAVTRATSIPKQVPSFRARSTSRTPWNWLSAWLSR